LIDPADAITPFNMNIHLLIYTPRTVSHATGRQTSSKQEEEEEEAPWHLESL
jgi:hypothetical protein